MERENALLPQRMPADPGHRTAVTGSAQPDSPPAVVAQVPVYHLECLPDAAAAELACRTIFGGESANPRP